MKVKFLINYDGKAGGHYAPGDVAELDEAEAGDVLTDSIAVRYVEAPAPVVVPEAVQTPSPKKKGSK